MKKESSIPHTIFFLNSSFPSRLSLYTVSINKNWANGDKAELFGAIAHELDHFLQWKAVIRNVDEEHPMYKAVYDQLTSTEVGIDNLSYILYKNDAPVTELSKKQAKAYSAE